MAKPGLHQVKVDAGVLFLSPGLSFACMRYKNKLKGGGVVCGGGLSPGLNQACTR